MSERVIVFNVLNATCSTDFQGIQKWEAAILEALVRIRDYSEKLLIPATQRLYILMTEVRGWSQL